MLIAVSAANAGGVRDCEVDTRIEITEPVFPSNLRPGHYACWDSRNNN
jgi:hypothetical protein